MSNSSRTGGVIIYFKKHWNVNKIKDNIKDSKYWISAYMAKYEKTSIIIVIIYRSPSGSKSEFCDIFQDFVEEICDKNTDILIAGDFNIDWNQDFYTSKLESILNDNGLKHLINEYTRITKRSKTLIDYIITNNESITAESNVNNKIADHESIDIFIECDNIEHENQVKEITLFKYNKTRFSNEIRSFLQYDEQSDFNDNVYNFDNVFENTVQRFCFKTKINKNRNNKWFNNDLKMLKREKVFKYQFAMFENTDEAWNNYKIIRNTYKVKLENEKNKYINDKINNARDQKEMWRKIKELVLRKPRKLIKKKCDI